MKRLWTLLRSRKLAVWTIAAFAVYAAIATVISDGDWGVPYRSPVFLAIAALLTLSTGACSWERTRAAIKGAVLKPAPKPVLERLRAEPAISVSVASGVDPASAVEHALAHLRMRVVRDGDAFEGRAGLAGAFGSPVFHWALTLLFVVVALGQLTRAEGLMGVVAGYSKPDLAESYGSLETGPFAGDLTGRLIAVPSIESSYTANGVEQGITPYVEIRSADGSTVLASGYAYANHPIRYHGMLVHANNDGLGAMVGLAGEGGSFTQEVLLDYNEDRTEVMPGLFGVLGADGTTIATVMLAPAEGSTVGQPTVRVQASSGNASPEMTPELDTVVAEGESVTLPGNITLTVVELTKYARLSVVDDWSVYWIYALFGLAAVGLTLAVFAPLRRVRVLIVGGDAQTSLHAAVRHGRGDPHFPARVEAALREASGTEEDAS